MPLSVRMSLERRLFSSFAHVFNRVIIASFCLFLPQSCGSPLHVLDVDPLSCTWFANPLSHSMHRLFIFFVSFAFRKLCRYMESHLSVFAVVACVFGAEFAFLTSSRGLLTPLVPRSNFEPPRARGTATLCTPSRGVGK